MPQERSEVIVCAVIKFELNGIGDIVVPMVRHYSPDGHRIIAEIEHKNVIEEKEQGFITNYGRFVDRKEALQIAKQNNQIKYGIGYEPEELYSEMLY